MKKIAALALFTGILASLACGLLPDFGDSATLTPRPTGESQGVTAPASDDDIPAAVIANDEGGPVVIQGEVPYTNPFFTEGLGQPLIILEDQSGFVDRDKDYIIPVTSQTIGQITSDVFTSPFTYSLALPSQPLADFHDVDNDNQTDTGIMVFAVAYWENIFDDPFLDERDLGGGGWSTAYASTRTSEEYETEGEIIGGKLIVYAPNDLQAFPSAFGEDGLLFTADDPVVRLPTGYTVVDMDVEPFVFDRAREQTMTLYEPEGAALDDFSEMSYTEAFDAMIDKMSKEYAFTEYKNVDWQALADEFRPEIERAQRNRDTTAYRFALQQMLWRVPDGHVSGPFVTEEFQAQKGGGLGLNIRETDDGTVYVTYVLADSVADEANIEVGAEIISINDTPIAQRIDETLPWLGPHSTEHNRRLDQMRFAVRFAPGERVTVTYRIPGSNSNETATMVAAFEVDSLLHDLNPNEQTGFELPIEYRLLENGYAYVKIYSFFDNKILTVELWDRLMATLNAEETPGLIIDMRENGGGWGYIADVMAAYFFNEELVLGNTGRYDAALDDFYFDPETEETFILPPEDVRYTGDVVVLVSPDCASACEFFSFDMTLENRATIIGHYPTAGLGGGVEEFNMPEDVTIRFTRSRAVGPDGEIHIEGIGVPPDIDVPLTRDALLGEEDILLQTAIDYLNGN